MDDMLERSKIFNYVNIFGSLGILVSVYSTLKLIKVLPSHLSRDRICRRPRYRCPTPKGLSMYHSNVGWYVRYIHDSILHLGRQETWSESSR